jgi:hypothetical protein
MSKQQHRKSVGRPATLTIPELERSEAAVLRTLASVHSRCSYKRAIERFISRYCDEPRMQESASEQATPQPGEWQRPRGVRCPHQDGILRETCYAPRFLFLIRCRSEPRLQ